jgi:pimeloyl-ACP methyl ester carboxylesterase
VTPLVRMQPAAPGNSPLSLTERLAVPGVRGQDWFRTIDELSVRCAESGERDDHALLLSPWPESLFAFEPTWLRLAEHTHLVAIDLPGFGHSQRRDALLSPRAMGEFVIRVADKFGLENPHVVGPDVGTGGDLPVVRLGYARDDCHVDPHIRGST